MIDLFKSAQAAGVIDDAPTFSEIALRAFNFLLTAAGIIAVISLVLSGILYFISGGDEKKMQLAKRAFTYSVYGLVVSLSALLIVKTLAGFL